MFLCNKLSSALWVNQCQTQDYVFRMTVSEEEEKRDATNNVSNWKIKDSMRRQSCCHMTYTTNMSHTLLGGALTKTMTSSNSFDQTFWHHQVKMAAPISEIEGGNGDVLSIFINLYIDSLMEPQASLVHTWFDSSVQSEPEHQVWRFLRAEEVFWVWIQLNHGSVGLQSEKPFWDFLSYPIVVSRSTNIKNGSSRYFLSC